MIIINNAITISYTKRIPTMEDRRRIVGGDDSHRGHQSVRSIDTQQRGRSLTRHSNKHFRSAKPGHGNPRRIVGGDDSHRGRQSFRSIDTQQRGRSLIQHSNKHFRSAKPGHGNPRRIVGGDDSRRSDTSGWSKPNPETGYDIIITRILLLLLFDRAECTRIIII